MNYPIFLKKTDDLCLRCDADKLREFIHELARTLPERNRERFLDTLSRFAEAKSADDTADKAAENTSVKEQVQISLNALESIQNGERQMDSECNEEWDDWNDSEEDEFIFSDPDSLLDDIQRVFNLMHLCVDREAYADGAKLAEAVSTLTVSVSGDYCDYKDELNIGDLIGQNLLEVDLEKATGEAVYLVFMGKPAEERAEAVLNILYRFCDTDFSLETMLQMGNDEIDLDGFLPSWIEALGKRTDRLANRLILEAQAMTHSEETVLNNAHRYAETHPALYRQILESNRGTAKDEQMLKVGLQALDEVPNNHTVRNDIALLAADYAVQLNLPDTAEACWLEAFRTYPSVVNYLRLRLMARNWTEIAPDVQAFYSGFSVKEYTLQGKVYASILFFEGKLDEMKEKFMQAGNGIGWSSTFMKEGIALLLLLLNSGSENLPGLNAMWKKALDACSFKVETYYAGTGRTSALDDQEAFREVFNSWKSQTSISEAEQNAWMGRLDKWISLRVAAIMDANRRGYYDECAAFVAALGEVRESLGRGSKASLMEKYRADYSRRRAFHEELRFYGMKK